MHTNMLIFEIDGCCKFGLRYTQQIFVLMYKWIMKRILLNDVIRWLLSSFIKMVKALESMSSTKF